MGFLSATATIGLLSFIVLARGESVSSACRQKAVLQNIYTSMHDAITRYLISNPDTQHIDLRRIGLSLDYDDFNPGKRPRFATPGTLALSVVENALPLVDKIFPTGATINPAPTNGSQSDKDYHFDSLSSTFDFILTHMMVLPRNFSSEEKLRAKYYLQELVPNPELVIQNKTELPRYLLYDYYRSLYLEEKEDRDTQMDSHRVSLPQQDYENWGVKKLPTLESNTNTAFQKWMIFGYKNEVEKELQYFDIDTHEDNLMSTRALFKSMAVYSQRDSHVQVYPFSFNPENWFQLLKSELAESSDELRYQKSLLQAQQALMNATRNDLANKTSEDVNNSLETIKQMMEELRQRVKNGVDKLLQMEVECFAKVNLTICGDIIDTHTSFRLLLDDVADHYEQAAYLESILNGREEALSVLGRKLSEVDRSIQTLDKRISQAEDAETSELLDLTTGRQNDNIFSTTCMEAGRVQFTFHTSQVDVEESCSEETETESDSELGQYCSDVRIPLNATQSSLWSVHSCAVDDDLEAFDDELDEFQSTMNTIDTQITASLHKVDIKRRWLDDNIFQDSNHYTMKRNRGIVSPGPVQPLNYFHQVAESGKYLMPQFTSSLVLASNVTLFFPGLGGWRDEDNTVDNHTSSIIKMLMKYAYAPILEGGYGPFSFSPKGGVRMEAHNFRVERWNGGILIRIPGAQLIGFISTVIAKFPADQQDPPTPLPCVLQPSEDSHKRRKRSALEEDTPRPHKIRDLSNKQFSRNIAGGHSTSEQEKRIDMLQHRNGYIPSDSLEKLMKDADMTQDKIDKFLQGMELQKDSPVPLPSDSVSQDGDSTKAEEV